MDSRHPSKALGFGDLSPLEAFELMTNSPWDKPEDYHELRHVGYENPYEWLYDQRTVRRYVGVRQEKRNKLLARSG